MSTVPRGRSRFGAAGLGLWCAIVATCLWSSGGAAGEVFLVDVAAANASFDRRTNDPIISIRLTEASGRLLSRITREYVGKPMALRVDGRELMKPIIREPIFGGSLQISGGFDVKEAQAIAARLSSGGKIELEILD